MKKSLFLIMTIIIFIFLFSGCGQNLQVTVWNNSGIVPYQNEWIAGTISSDTGTTRSQLFLESADNITGSTDVPLDDYNSFTVTIKENAKITVTANGQRYVIDSNGNTSIAVFSNTSYQTIYGGFPDPPHWYAACFYTSVVIYKK